MLSVFGLIFHLFKEILTKKTNWVRLRWLRQRLAEAETAITHLCWWLVGVPVFAQNFGNLHDSR